MAPTKSSKPSKRTKPSTRTKPPATPAPGARGKTGRPSGYEPERHVTAVFELALLGKTEEQIADALEVSVRTLATWKNKHPDFLQALKRGASLADGAVVRSLYERATGYSHKAVKLFYDKEKGVVEHEYTERFAPDTTAAIFWLKNRQRLLWRDRHELGGDPDNPIVFTAEVPRSVRREDAGEPPGAAAS